MKKTKKQNKNKKRKSALLNALLNLKAQKNLKKLSYKALLAKSSCPYHYGLLENLRHH